LRRPIGSVRAFATSLGGGRLAGVMAAIKGFREMINETARKITNDALIC
jgi:hypothetical protein